MNVLLWILQIGLAIVFLASGAAKISMSRERLIATGQTGIAVYPMPVVRIAALGELLGAAGLVLPWATAGLCIVMIGAAAAHTKLREPRNVLVNALLFALAGTLAIARLP